MSTEGAAGVSIDETRPSTRAGLGLVWLMVRPHLLPTITAIIGAAVFAAGTVASAAVLGWVTDDIILAAFANDAVAGDAQPLPVTRAAPAFGAAVIMAVTIIRIGGVVVRRYFAGMTSELAERTVREGLATQYLSQPMSWLRSGSTGRFLAHVHADARVFVESLHPFPFAFGVVCLVVFTGVRLFVIDPSIVLIAIVLFPAMWLINNRYAAAAQVPLAAVQSDNAVVAGIAHESFEGALIVKTLGRRSAEVERFDHAANDLRVHRERAGFLRAFMDAGIHLLIPFGILAVVVLGAYRIRSGAMTPGNIVEVAAIFAALGMPMHVFGFLLESLVPTVVAWNRLRPVIEADPPSYAAARRPVATGALGVQVDRLTYAWPDAPDEPVLHDVSLQIEPGESIAIVGATGAGKSTLVAAIAGILDDAGHAVLLDGRRLSEVNPDDRARSIAYAFQEAFLFASSVRSNIDLSNEHDLDTIRAAAQVASIDSWITEQPEGYETVLGERGVTVSGGQRQRIALARTLLRPAGLVVLDDATSAIDTVVEREILDHLRGASSATLLLVANRLATIALADRVVYMADGRIIAVGTHERLLDHPDYRALVLAYEDGHVDA